VATYPHPILLSVFDFERFFARLRTSNNHEMQVSSQETPLRCDSSEFTYDLNSARSYQARGTVPSMGPITSQYSPEGIPVMGSGEMLSSYRHVAGSGYPYIGKGCYGSGVPAWSANGYTEDAADYGLQWVAVFFFLSPSS
jgi:hypothetical protein